MIVDPLLQSSIDGLLDRHWREHAAAHDPAAGELWDAIVAAGFAGVGVPTDRGGAGGSVADAATLVWALARRAAPAPLAETAMIGGWALAAAGLPLPDGPVTSQACVDGDQVALTRRGGSWRVSARLQRVPWARRAVRVVCVAECGGERYAVSLERRLTNVVEGYNMAGEPRDLVVVDDAVVSDDAVAATPGSVDLEQIRLRGALARSVAIAGALERTAALTVAFANERVQFGKPIASFQAVAALLVRMVEAAESAALAARVAVGACDCDCGAGSFEIAVAKSCASAAAGTVAQLAHQVHGAIGITEEYELGRMTRRLWSWRQEFGSGRAWNRWIGERVLHDGADELLPRLTQSTGAR